MTAALARGLAYAGLGVSLLAILAVVAAPRVAGIEFASVLSDSMRPAMTRGDMIVVRSVDPAQIGVGDIILFRVPDAPGITVAHRVVEIRDGAGSLAFVTKGDANNVEDEGAVPPGLVLGKVQFGVPLVGYATREMREPLVFILVLAVPAGLIIVGEMWNIVRALKKGRSEKLGAGPGGGR